MHDHEEIRQKVSQGPKRDTYYFQDISGPDKHGRPKAHVMLRYYDVYSDGTEKELGNLAFEKPILSIFKHAGIVNVRMDFKQNIDVNLAMCWKMLDRYSRPENSVSYLDEELDSGVYIDENGKECLVHFPTIDLTLSPIGKETEYAMLGINPLYYTLHPNELNGDASVLELVFFEDAFHVEVIPDIDMVEIEQEIRRETGEDV